MSLRYLTAALVAGLALSFAPTAPAADEDPGVRAPRVRMPPRVRTRTVVRTVERIRYVPVYSTCTCGGCAQPVAWQAPRYYAAGCDGCGPWAAAPYYWAVRYARYHAHRYHY